MSDVYVPTTTKVYQKKQINIYNQQDRLSGVLVIWFFSFYFFVSNFKNLYVAVVYIARSFWAWAASMESKAAE
jgi:hypothetical protein